MIAFLLAHLWTILGTVIGLGTGGVGLFAIFGLGMSVPAVIDVVLGAVKAFFAFLKTPLGQALGVMALCALFLLIGIVHTARTYEKKIAALNMAHRHDIAELNVRWQAKIDEAADKFRTERARRDKAVDDEIGAKVAAATKDLADRADKLKAEVNTYAKLSHPNCVLGPADLDDGMRAPRR